MSEPSDPEELRRRYRYRTLILRGKLRLSLVAARALVGPDCAYHLYRGIGAGGEDPTYLVNTVSDRVPANVTTDREEASGALGSSSLQPRPEPNEPF
jgi:hypothetical protein